MSQLKGGIVLLYSVLMQLHLKFYVLFWALQYKDSKLLESFKRRATKMMKGPEEKSYEG